MKKTKQKSSRNIWNMLDHPIIYILNLPFRFLPVMSETIYNNIAKIKDLICHYRSFEHGGNGDGNTLHIGTAIHPPPDLPLAKPGNSPNWTTVWSISAAESTILTASRHSRDACKCRCGRTSWRATRPPCLRYWCRSLITPVHTVIVPWWRLIVPLITLERNR